MSRKRMASVAYDSEIMNYAFQTICDKQDVAEAIELLLQTAGNRMQLEKIQVFEFSKEIRQTVRTFFWDIEGEVKSEIRPLLSYSMLYKKFSIGCYKEVIPFFDEESALKEDTDIKEALKSIGINNAYIGVLLEEGRPIGFVTFEGNDIRNISEETKHSMLVTANVLSIYLIKLRVIETIREKLDYMKNYDDLTQLPNLHKFKKEVKEILHNYPNEKFAIVYTDFGNFKYINETIGEAAGDQILIDFARHLKRKKNDICRVARVESDRFICFMKDIGSKKLLQEVNQENETFRVEMKQRSIVNNVTLVSGICPICYGDDINVAIDNANLARKSIGAESKLSCRFFDQEIKNKIHREIEITNNMEEALDNNEFIVYLQPKVELANNETIGAEALVRWKKADDEILPPNAFIPIFEKNGFIIDLDYFIYEQVCKILCRWRREGKRIVPISVNVSRIHLYDDHFVDKVKGLVEKYEIPPSWLELELTESIFLNNKEIALTTMKELREYGFFVSIDDFGAGYSSLNLLKDMTTDVLKLDKEFFRAGTMNREEKIIISSIVTMAKRLNMKVLSEGIETDSQSEFLRDIKCDMAQGYLFSHPIPIESFEKLLLK